MRLVEELTDYALTNAACGAVSLGAVRVGVTARACDDRYASQELVDTEARILERAVSGGFRAPARLPAELMDELAAGRDPALTAEQLEAVARLVSSRDLLTVMTAPAGAGKTTTLAAAAGICGHGGREVIMLAPSARAAAELSAATGAPGHTVARWLLQQRRPPGTRRTPGNQARLGPGSVVVVDEASMLSTADLDQLTAHVASARATLVLVGDPAQIGAVNAPGGMFEHLIHTMGARTVELTELHRFTNPWEGAATLRLRDGDPSVLADYVDHGRVHPEPSSQDAADAVFARWQHAADWGQDALMLAKSWADVSALNARARVVGIATGAITGSPLATVTSRTASTQGHPEQRTWLAGDILIAKRNTTQIPIGTDTLRNGDRFRVLAASEGGGLVVEDLRGRGTTTLPTPYLARHAEYGWAATIDGAQGATADVGIVLARSGLDREHLYVAMSRGRAENHVHTTPEVMAGDAGPHRPTPAPTQPPGLVAPASAQPHPLKAALAPAPVTAMTARGPFKSSLTQASDALRASPTATGACLPTAHGHDTDQPSHSADLDSAIAQLAAAIRASGRERAAHTLLDEPVERARELAWTRREELRPPRPIPDGHRRHLRDLERARADLDRVSETKTRVATQVRDLEGQLVELPFWARGRRRDLQARLEVTNDGLLRHVDTEVHRAERRVAAAAEVVDTDTAQRLDADRADRERRHRDWLEQPRRPYIDPNQFPRRAGGTAISPSRQPRQPYRTPAPPARDHGIQR